MDDFCDFTCKTSLTVAGGWIFVVFGEDFFELIRHDESEVFEVFFESIVGLVEPELIEVKDGSFFGV